MEFEERFLKTEEIGVPFNLLLFSILLLVLVFSDQKEMHLALVKRQIVLLRMFPRGLKLHETQLEPSA